MSIRYLANLALGVAAAFLIVATRAFADTTAVWLTFAIAIGATGIGIGLAAAVRDPIQRAIGSVTAVIGAWTIVASLVFSNATAVTLGFASALALAALAIAGLTAHELRTERVVHSFELGQNSEESSDLQQPLAA